MTEPVPEPDRDTYALKSAIVAEFPAPKLPYLPPSPKHYRPRTGVIGAGGIAATHLDAYRAAGWEVAATCNRTLSRAGARAAEFAPRARVTDRYEDVLSDPSIDVVDITPHPADRTPIVEAALKAGKHVLSQKPFVLDLATGERLVRLADDNGVKLVVNQNGRWAPHLAWTREAGVVKFRYLGPKALTSDCKTQQTVCTFSEMFELQSRETSDIQGHCSHPFGSLRTCAP